MSPFHIRPKRSFSSRPSRRRTATPRRSGGGRLERLEDRRLLAAGPYAPAAGLPGSTAVSADDPAIVGWASGVADYSPGDAVSTVWQDADEALGPAEGAFDRVVSLGRGGTLTLTFDDPIRDGLGFDFAVFENSFSDDFLELGFVEVSSDGVQFVRFPADSLTPDPVGAFGGMDPTHLHQLAGKYRAGFGVPFDLEVLGGSAGLDITAVTHVRLVDIVGDGLTTDADGDPIYDPTPTVETAGLDVDAVAVLRALETGPHTVDLENLGSSLAGTFDNGSNRPADHTFAEDELRLNNDYNTTWQSWRGFAISQETDATTPGYLNQYSAFPGTGAADSATYAVGFYDGSATDPANLPTLSLASESDARFDRLSVSNTTYAALSMRDGDSFAKRFGGPDGSDPDYLLLHIHGLDAAGQSVGTVTFPLADFRFDDDSLDYIVDTWQSVDVSSLESARSLQFTMESSDAGDFGINTPTYFAIDDVTLRRPAVPLDFSTHQINETQSATARVSRLTSDRSEPLTVMLTATGDPSVPVPASITIPAGSAYAEFPLTPLNDSLAGPGRTLSVTATVGNEFVLPTKRELQITDDDSLTLTFAQSNYSVAENQPESLRLELSRNDADISDSLTVQLVADETELLEIPQQVTFAPGQRSLSLDVPVGDDDVAGSGQSIGLTATAADRPSVSTTIQVTEDDAAALTLSPVEGVVREFEPDVPLQVTIHRNSADLSQPQEVAISVPAGAPLVAPSTVIIPAGSETVGFDIVPLQDDVTPVQTHWQVTASLAGFISDSVLIEAVDDDTRLLEWVGPSQPLLEQDGPSVGDFESFATRMLDGEHQNNAGPDGAFFSGDVSLGNSFDDSLGYEIWSGFAISRGNDPDTPGFANQFSSVTGSGAGGSHTYAVAYAASPVEIHRPAGSQPFASIDITNTAYAAWSMRQGDAFAKQFGGPDGTEPDFLRLTIEGFDVGGNSTGTLQVDLADFRFDDDSLDFILDDWATVDLSPIGDATRLSFSLASSDNGPFGMNTPAYFAVDNVLLSPDPAVTPTITIRRNAADLRNPLTVELTTDRPGLLLPDSVVIPAHVSEVTVPVSVIDDSFASASGDIGSDNATSWTLLAAAPDHESASGPLEAIDDDDPLLTLTSRIESVGESMGRAVVGFEDVGGRLSSENFENGSDELGGFGSHQLWFANDYDPAFGSWSGWALSNVTDVTTPGFTNQFAAFANLDATAPGGGADDSSTYAVASNYGDPLVIDLPTDPNAPLAGAEFQSIRVANTTYAALSMRDGDAFAKQFGGPDGTDEDFFRLDILGIGPDGNEVGTVEFYLADFRFDDSSLDYIVDDWSSVDLTSLAGATRLTFSLSSSDNGSFGMNTPAYFAIDAIELARPAAVPPTMIVHRNDADLSEPLEVQLSSAMPERIGVPSTVVIPAGEVSVAVPLEIWDDAVVQGDTQVSFTATAAPHMAAAEAVTLLDNDSAGIRWSTGDIDGNSVDGSDPVVIAEGGSADLAIRLQDQPTDTVTVQLGSTDPAVTLSTTTLVFHPETWNQPQTVQLTAPLDLLANPDHELTMQWTIDPAVTDAAVYTETTGDAIPLRLLDVSPDQIVIDHQAEQVRVRDQQSDQVWIARDRFLPVEVRLDAAAQDARIGPLVPASGPIWIDLGGGDDRATMHSIDVTTLDGGEGDDHLLLELLTQPMPDSLPLDLATFLNEKVSGFEHLMISHSNAAPLPIAIHLDVAALAALPDHLKPAVRVAAGHRLSHTGVPQFETLVHAGDHFEHQIRLQTDVAETSLTIVSDNPNRNPLVPYDVNGDGNVSALDALTVINRLNRDSNYQLEPPTNGAEWQGPFFDVSDDQVVSALDALRVINQLNDHDAAPGGESAGVIAPAETWADQVDSIWQELAPSSRTSSSSQSLDDLNQVTKLRAPVLQPAVGQAPGRDTITGGARPTSTAGVHSPQDDGQVGLTRHDEIATALADSLLSEKLR